MDADRRKGVIETYASHIGSFARVRGIYYTRTQAAYDLEARIYIFFRRKGHHDDPQGLHDLLETCRRVSRLYLAQHNGTPLSKEEISTRIKTSLQSA